MQASRLLKILMLLQSRGRQTAPQLAAELEVSTRTVLRDIDELSAAGVPLWGEPGRYGGFQLQAGWSTQLTGMTEMEAQALWLAGLPQAAAELGLGGAAASARLKLLASVPAPQRGASNRVAQRLHLDPLDWYRAADTPQHLQAVAAAVWQGHCIRVQYESWKGLQRRQLAPLGLVLKAGAWYLIAVPAGAREPRTYRLASLRDCQPLGEGVQRPHGFDLASYWQGSTLRFEAELRRLAVRVRASPRALGWLLNARIPHEALEPEGEYRLWFEGEEMALRQLLGFGAELELLEPAGLRQQLREQALAVAARY
jgi:predicted DNA-binding transcriptional regulator YafY